MGNGPRIYGTGGNTIYWQYVVLSAYINYITYKTYKNYIG